MSEEKRFYVYSHSHNGKIFYIGKGTKQRAWRKHCGRSLLWSQYVESIGGEYDVDIIRRFDSSDEAFAFENKQIKKFTPYCNLIGANKKEKRYLTIGDLKKQSMKGGMGVKIKWDNRLGLWKISIGSMISEDFYLSERTVIDLERVKILSLNKLDKEYHLM